jgi:quercetin dioxygenase-like cupin family protein
MRSLLWITVLVSLAVAPLAAQKDYLDAPKVDSKYHKVEFENDQVRVVRYVVPPGAKTALHDHPKAVLVVLSDYDGRVTTPDGKTTDSHAKAGSASWREPVRHVFENVGKQDATGVLIEPKKPASAMPAGTKGEITSDPARAKVEFENEQVRVIRYHYNPGDKSAMHGHPDNVQVVLTDSKAMVTTPDGKSTPGQAKAGEVRWRKATQHSVQNTGDQPFDGILVELKGTPPASK